MAEFPPISAVIFNKISPEPSLIKVKSPEPAKSFPSDLINFFIVVYAFAVKSESQGLNVNRNFELYSLILID